MSGLINDAVALVLDELFGLKLADLCVMMPVWIIESPSNDLAIEMGRSSGCESITKLLSIRDVDKLSILARAIYAIEDHHHAFSTLRIYGVQHEDLSASLALEYGFTSVGFVDAWTEWRR